MTAARQWTREELDRVHPLPEADGFHILYAWEWCVAGPHVSAREVDTSEPNEVWVDGNGNLASSEGEPPASVALAVILASRGMDSREAMAAAMDTVAERVKAAPIASEEMRGRAWQATAAAMMLRRGRVAP
jgi:hypothetical protein